MFTTLLSFALLATSALAFKVTVPDTAAQVMLTFALCGYGGTAGN